MPYGGPRPNPGRKQKFLYIIKGKEFKTLKSAAKAFNVSAVTIHNWCGNGSKSRDDCQKEPIKSDKEVSNKQVLDELKQEAEKSELMPMEYFLEIMRNEGEDKKRRDTAAYYLLPYLYPKADKKTGKKDERAGRAAKASSGKFSPSKTPHLKVAK